MQEVELKNLKKVKGGISIFTILSILTAGVFASGIFDGFVRPFGCRKWYK